MCLMQFRTWRIDVYKDTLLGQMASSEEAEVWSPESCWIEQLERWAVKPWKQDQYITMVEKSNCTADRWIFLNYEAKKARP